VYAYIKKLYQLNWRVETAMLNDYCGGMPTR
jgi:hypothetical protein